MGALPVDSIVVLVVCSFLLQVSPILQIKCISLRPSKHAHLYIFFSILYPHNETYSLQIMTANNHLYFYYDES